MSIAELMMKLPEEIIVNHIAPFTYLKQDSRLLEDIRNFHTETRLLENIYYTEFNDWVLLFDLIGFCNSGDVYSPEINDTFENILRRSPVLVNISKKDLNTYRLNLFMDSLSHKPGWKIKFLWGLLSPRERTMFINRVLVNLEN
jgi:hypothetical protein